MRALAAAAALLCFLNTAIAQGTDPARSPISSKVSSMKIRMTVGTATVEATLLDNPTSRDFYSMLPVTVAIEDYAATEKIAYLSRKLAITGAPEGTTPSAGDVSYYAPWGNLAIFYRDFKHSPGLVHLGRIDSGLEGLRTSAAQKVIIQKASD